MNPVDTQKRHGIPSFAIRQQIWAANSSLANGRESLKEKTKAVLRKYGYVFRLLRAIKAAAVAPQAIAKEVVFLAKSFRIIRTFDILIISGGGQLLESWGGPWSYPYTIFKWIVLAKLSRVKCYFINVGAGPLKHPLSKYFVTRALHLADYASFRDAKSRALAQEIGFTG